MIKLTNLLKKVLTEISVEQLKTQFVDSGKISQEDFNEITNVTPKTAYITWLTKKIVDRLIKVEDIYKYKKYFNIFDRRKKEYPFTDINQYKTSDDLSQFISKSVEIADKESEDVSQQKGISKTDKYKEFYIGSVDEFDVYKLPEGRKDLYGASCELGSGTEWCTATGKTREHFDYYISDGPLFIFIKPGSKEKYQFHYESQSFMDKNDEDVKINKKIYSLFKFIENKEPQYKPPFAAKLIYEPETLTPEDLNIKGDFMIDKIQTTFLPDNLNIEGTLYIQNSPITSLPDNLKVGGLSIFNIPITSLPNDLNIKNNLSIADTQITSLPDNLKINGKLRIYNTPITSLPDNLKVGGGLDISNIPITSFPNNLNIKGNLWLKNTPISKKYSEEDIRKMIKDKGGNVGGNIWI